MPAPIRLFLFDLGNVLVRIDVDAVWKTLGMYTSGAYVSIEHDYETLTCQYETGLISTEIFLEKLHTLLRHQYSLHEIRHAFENIIVHPLEGMDELVAEISTKYQTALVSNTNELHFNKSHSQYAVVRSLNKYFLSYQLLAMKPADQYYQSVIREQPLPPSEMIFIDDLEKNVEGARRAGMQAILFTGINNLRDELKQRGLL